MFKDIMNGGRVMGAVASAAALTVCNVDVSAAGHPLPPPPTPKTNRTFLAEVIKTVL